MSVQIWVLTVPRLASPRFLDFPSRSNVAPPHKSYPCGSRLKSTVHLAFLYRVFVACRMYSCIPLCSDIIDVKINRLFVHESSNRIRRIVKIASAAPSLLVENSLFGQQFSAAVGNRPIRCLPACRCGWHAGYGKTLFWPLDVAML